MSEQELACVLHVGGGRHGSIDEKIQPFTDSTWQKVQTIAESRLKYGATSKYCDVAASLPPELNSSLHGYHKHCYSCFTALPKSKQHHESKTAAKPSPLLRSMTEPSTTCATGVFEAACLFDCKCVTKYVKGRREGLSSCMTYEAQNRVREAALGLKDSKMLAKIADVEFMAKEVKYHLSCKKEYTNRADRLCKSGSKTDSEYSHVREAHRCAYDQFRKYIHNNLIETEGAELLTSLHKKYMSVLAKQSDTTDATTYTAQKLGDKIMKDYEGILVMSSNSSKKQGNVIHHNKLNKKEAVQRACVDMAYITDAALNIRSQVLHILNTSEELPNPLTAEAVNKGQAQPPEALKHFFRVLYTGSSKKADTGKENDYIDRLVQSSAEDALYIITRGRVKPAKHLLMGLGMKSMTGKRKVVELLNRFGHSVSYHVVETMETELATSIAHRETMLPDGLVAASGLGTALAWDNYDENIETLSGAGTLHDTVGICYQNAKNDSHPISDLAASTDAPSTSSSSSTPLQRRSKRRFSFESSPLEPYHKRPKTSVFEYSIKAVETPTNLLLTKRRDILWMMSCRLHETPSWVGWNSCIISDSLDLHNIAYMENICASPTRLDVVAETLKRSKKVADECGDTYAIVTYDLAIAKPAIQIQAQEAPLYDSVFICFGPFHILMAFFGSLGYILDGSGGPEILCETELLAPGSVNGFVLGKHFNRCKRLHIMLATALHILHFDSFLENTESNVPDSLHQKIQEISKCPSLELLQMIEESYEFRELMTSYEAYCDDTRKGKHGKTGQFWFSYVEMVDMYLRLSRACRTNDIDLFIHSLSDMCDIFFATNRQNYKRWMVRYILNLVNMDVSHPGVREILEKGTFSIRRTHKCFSRTPVDQALEQTINADAASRLTGIAAFSQSSYARRRWMITRAARSRIVGHLFSKAGLSNSEDITKELTHHRIKRDSDDLQTLVNGIVSMMNPFGDSVKDENLYCLSNGKQLQDSIAQDMLTVKEQGNTWRKEFEGKCFADPKNFDLPIPRRKVKNFATQAVKINVTSKNLKAKEIKATRDLFGRLLYLSVTKKLDMLKVLSYPLTPVPLSLAHVDGSPNKTDKAKLLHFIESRIGSCAPSSIDANVVDAMFMIRSLVSVAVTYGDIAKEILQKLCVHPIVHFVCDTYWLKSIKEVERERRGAQEMSISITGPKQKIPRDFHKALQSTQFKTSFLQYLRDEWKQPKYKEILEGHSVFMGIEKECFSYTVENGQVSRKSVPELFCEHEEADTRIAFHVKHIQDTHPGSNVSIRANDADVGFILLHHCQFFKYVHIWMDAGLSGRNTRRFVDISTLATELGPDLCEALLGLHAFTGSDYTAAFMNKGKVKPFKIMEKSYSYTATFSKIGVHESKCDDILPTIEEFVCEMYGQRKEKAVNEARYALFLHGYAPKDINAPLQKIRGANPSSFPPCRDVLTNKLKRAHYVTSVWKHALLSNPVLLNPADYGWIDADNSYSIKWFDGCELPQNVMDIIDSDTESSEDEDDEPQYDSDIDGSDEEEEGMFSFEMLD